MFGHRILKMYLRHRLTKICILRRISLVTSHVSHPYKSTDFTQALKILILVTFRIDVDTSCNKIFNISESEFRNRFKPTFTLYILHWCKNSTAQHTE